jgi:hypothetical protein
VGVCAALLWFCRRGACSVKHVMSVAAQSAVSSPPALDRAFYFIVVLWGERFRQCFLDFCLASVLSPANIPALTASRRNKFLIATRPEDWTALRDAPMFRLLERYVEPVYIEIPPCPPGRSGCQHMGTGHRLACEMAHRDQAYAVFLTPDSMLSDGSVARLQELARGGTQLVIAAALRFGEEPFFAHLREIGAVPAEGHSEAAKPLAITGRQMVYAAVNGFHSETLAYEWDAPGLMVITPAAWWRVPREDGIVLHSLSWAPLLLDYAAVGDHDTSTFDQWTLDGDYLFNNSDNIKRIHVVQDSDEMFLASWGPLDERPVNKIRFPFDKFLAGSFFKRSFYSEFFDPFKRSLFFLPVRWHARPLNAEWTGVENRASHELQRWLQPPNNANLVDARPAPEPAVVASENLSIWLLRALAYLWIFRRFIGAHLLKAVRGDFAATGRMTAFVRTFILGTEHISGKARG